MKTSRQIRSLITEEAKLELSIQEHEVPYPKDDEVLIKVEASPINPSDLGLLLGPADVSTMESSGEVVTMDVPQSLLRSVGARIGQSLPVGNEGSGTVLITFNLIGQHL